MGRILVLTGVFLILAGLVVNFLPKGKIPLLPGDILIQKNNFTFYFPIITSLIVSAVLTILFSLFK